ncbi:MAG: histidine phosphatase family protein [Candidatus Gracilibacteria bacterium]
MSGIFSEILTKVGKQIPDSVTLVLMRHGEYEEGADKQFHLTAVGRSKLLKGEFSSGHIQNADYFVSSMLPRAVETAMAVLYNKALKGAVEVPTFTTDSRIGSDGLIARIRTPHFKDLHDTYCKPGHHISLFLKGLNEYADEFTAFQAVILEVLYGIVDHSANASKNKEDVTVLIVGHTPLLESAAYCITGQDISGLDKADALCIRGGKLL